MRNGESTTRGLLQGIAYPLIVLWLGWVSLTLVQLKTDVGELKLKVFNAVAFTPHDKGAPIQSALGFPVPNLLERKPNEQH